MNKKYIPTFRTCIGFGILFLLTACGAKLSDERAVELIRLNYRQQSTVEGAGKWLLDSVIIDQIENIPGDTSIKCKVLAHTTGLYRVPSIEDAPHGLTEAFSDTLTFVATKINKIWKAGDWVIVGARHE